MDASIRILATEGVEVVPEAAGKGADDAVTLVSAWLIDEIGRPHQLWFPSDRFITQEDVADCDWGGFEMRLPDARDTVLQPFMDTPPHAERLVRPGDGSLFLDARLNNITGPVRLCGADQWLRAGDDFLDWLKARAKPVAIGAIEGQSLIADYRNLGRDQSNLLASLNVFVGRRLHHRLQSADQIPAFPEIAKRLLRFKQDPNGNLRGLTTIISDDPSLAGQIFGWARSAYYYSRSVDTLEQAIGRVLGIERVLNYSIALALVNHFGHFPKERYARLKTFWERALLVGSACREIGALYSDRDHTIRDHAYLAGLLHNFGEIVLATLFPEQMMLVDRHERANAHLNPALVQMATLGLSCDQIGAWIADYWGLGQDITLAIRYCNDGKASFFNGREITLAQVLNASLETLASNGFIDHPPISSRAGQRIAHDSADVVVRLQHAQKEIIHSAQYFQGTAV